MTALLCALLMAPAQAERHALLVGVGNYQDAGVSKLEGPPHDIAALRQFLIDRWGVAPGRVRTLVDREATRDAFLAEIEQLAGRVTASDEVLIYFSGHGTSRYDSNSALPIAHGSGAYFPWDGIAKGDKESVMARLVIGNRDLRPRLDKLDRTGASVLVVADSCFSGNSVRSTARARTGGLPSRQAPLLITGDAALGGGVGEGARPAPPPYPYKNIGYLSAANDTEVARDIGTNGLDENPTLDRNPHGAFTDALLRVLAGDLSADGNRDGRLTHDELRLATQTYLAQRGFQHTPQLLPPAEADPAGLRDRSLFTARSLAVVPADKFPPLRVALGTGATALEPLVRKESGMQPVAEGAEADVRIQAEGGDWLLLDGGGDALGRIPSGDTGKALYRLRLQQWVQGLKWRQLHANPLGLKLDLVPDQGGNFRFGEGLTLRMAVAKPVWLVLLDIDSSGGIVPLYPKYRTEIKPLAAGDAVLVPDPDMNKPIIVGAPEGTDHILALAFTGQPEGLEQILGKDKLAFDDPALTAWRNRVAAGKDDTSAAVAIVRTLKGDGK